MFTVGRDLHPRLRPTGPAPSPQLFENFSRTVYPTNALIFTAFRTFCAPVYLFSLIRLP